mmetsp:Transcript_97992/g.169758  ORF Transcript_97992/g.169758 Transcript_97992/m.169758 type:complete len:236 (+) Transcript_97992:1057-1764(+)
MISSSEALGPLASAGVGGGAAVHGDVNGDIGGMPKTGGSPRSSGERGGGDGGSSGPAIVAARESGVRGALGVTVGVCSCAAGLKGACMPGTNSGASAFNPGRAEGTPNACSALRTGVCSSAASKAAGRINLARSAIATGSCDRGASAGATTTGSASLGAPSTCGGNCGGGGGGGASAGGAVRAFNGCTAGGVDATSGDGVRRSVSFVEPSTPFLLLLLAGGTGIALRTCESPSVA